MGGCRRRALGGAVGESCWGRPVGWSCGTSAQLTQGGLRNACSSLEIEKPWGTLGAGWKPRKKLVTQGTQLTAPVFKRQFHKRRGSLRDRLDECWRLLRKKMPQGPTGSRSGAYGHTERDAGPTRGISSTPSPTQVQLLY